jgi:hypothetical protein
MIKLPRRPPTAPRAPLRATLAFLVGTVTAPVAIVAFAAPPPASADAGIVALTPKPNEHVAAPPKSIQMRVTSRSSLDKSAVRVVVDGRDVSDAIAVAGNVVTYQPAATLSSGDHAVEVAVTDTAGGRLSYSWTFTVDHGAAQPVQAQAPAAGSAGGAVPAAPPDDAAQPSDGNAPDAGAGLVPQNVYGQQNFYGGFYPIGGSPYYWGDNAQFEFEGIPGGYGFLTFAGIPGVFDLLPLGFNTFYATVPIPIGFIITNPYVTCHFFTPGGSGAVVKLPSFPIVRHRRPGGDPPVHTAALGSGTALRSSAERMLGAHTLPHARTSVPATFTSLHPGDIRSIPHAPMHVEAPHFIAPAPVHISAQHH